MRLGRRHVDASTSGRSSRSTLTQTKRSFIWAAVASSSNDSCAITWHQWQAAYPTESSTGTSRARASANASSPHSRQSTGLSACWSRYGLRGGGKAVRHAALLTRAPRDLSRQGTSARRDMTSDASWFGRPRSVGGPATRGQRCASALRSQGGRDVPTPPAFPARRPDRGGGQRLLSLLLPAAAAAAPYCGITWGSLAEVGNGNQPVPGATLTDVRAGRQACYDRLVLDIRGRRRSPRGGSSTSPR